jgi:hypothetical protein
VAAGEGILHTITKAHVKEHVTTMTLQQPYLAKANIVDR